MINGKYDPLFPFANSQTEIYKRLATPEEDKNHKTFLLGTA